MAVPAPSFVLHIRIGGDRMIQIYEDYYLDADTQQFILTKKRVSKPSEKNNVEGGKVYFTAIGYYQRIEGIFDRVVRECEKDCIMSESVVTFKDLIDRMSGIVGTLSGLIHEFETVTYKDAHSKGNDNDGVFEEVFESEDEE